jgi:hypothetical protein
MSAPPTDLVDRLQRLAAGAPGAGVDPDRLWTRGRRRQGLRRTAAVAGVAVLSGLGAIATGPLIQVVDAPVASDPGAGMVLPDVLRQPGGLDPVLEDAPGRLSAIGVGEAFSWRTLSRTSPWWAVSATTGEAGFLDLPAIASVDTPVLSADGRLLAYWATGDVGGTPVLHGQELEEGDEGVPVVGVAVLDLETGERQVWEIASTHGLYTGGLAWAGDVLWWWAGPIREVNGTFGGEPLAHTWDVRTGERDASVEDAGTPVGFSYGSGDAPGGFLSQDSPRRLRWVTATGSTTIRLVMPDGVPAGADPSDYAISTDGSRIAVLVPPDRDRREDLQSVLVGEVVDGEARLTDLAGVETRDVAGWRSPTEVVLIQDAGPREGRAPQGLAAWAVDVTTGERSRLIDFEVANTPRVTAEAWTAEVVPAPDAPFAPDPRLVGLGLLAGSFVAWRLVVRVRRRRGDA